MPSRSNAMNAGDGPRTATQRVHSTGTAAPWSYLISAPKTQSLLGTIILAEAKFRLRGHREFGPSHSGLPPGGIHWVSFNPAIESAIFWKASTIPFASLATKAREGSPAQVFSMLMP